jgi:hypothetical protein
VRKTCISCAVPSTGGWGGDVDGAVPLLCRALVPFAPYSRSANSLSMAARFTKQNMCERETRFLGACSAFIYECNVHIVQSAPLCHLKKTYLRLILFEPMADLSTLVFEQGRVVTFLTAAREFEISADAAKTCVARGAEGDGHGAGAFGEGHLWAQWGGARAAAAWATTAFFGRRCPASPSRPHPEQLRSPCSARLARMRARRCLPRWCHSAFTRSMDATCCYTPALRAFPAPALGHSLCCIT